MKRAITRRIVPAVILTLLAASTYLVAFAQDHPIFLPLIQRNEFIGTIPAPPPVEAGAPLILE